MEIKIEKKRKKNASIRIDNSGLVIVSVPLYFTDKMIDEFITKYDSWIKKNLTKAIDNTIIENIYESSTIYILGTEYIIRIISSDKNYIDLTDGFMNIYTKSNDESTIKKIYLAYKKDLINKTYKEVIDKYLSLTGLSINKLIIKSLKRTYGKCYYTKKEIILSDSLIHRSLRK